MATYLVQTITRAEDSVARVLEPRGAATEVDAGVIEPLTEELGVLGGRALSVRGNDDDDDALIHEFLGLVLVTSCDQGRQQEKKKKTKPSISKSD